MDESVTVWIGKMRGGDPSGAQQIWQRYYGELLRIARGKLYPAERRVIDEEDIVSMALEQLWSGIQEGRFPQLADRHGCVERTVERKVFLIRSRINELDDIGGERLA